MVLFFVNFGSKVLTMKRYFSLLALFFFLAVTSLAQETSPIVEDTVKKADWRLQSQWGLGIKGGLRGVGFEVIKGFGDRINIRFGYSAFEMPFTLNQSLESFEIQADTRLVLGGPSLFVDLYPVKNYIHFTLGAVQNRTLVGLSLSTTNSFPYGDIMIPPSEMGSITAQVTPELPFSPYLALGFGNTLSRNHRVSFNFEIGAIYHGEPQVTLTGEGVVGPIASENNARILAQSIAPYQLMPNFALQFSFRIL